MRQRGARDGDGRRMALALCHLLVVHCTTRAVRPYRLQRLLRPTQDLNVFTPVSFTFAAEVAVGWYGSPVRLSSFVDGTRAYCARALPTAAGTVAMPGFFRRELLQSNVERDAEDTEQHHWPDRHDTAKVRPTRTRRMKLVQNNGEAREVR